MDKAKILEGLKMIKAAFATTQKFVDAKLNDGITIIRYDGDKLAVSIMVSVVTDQGVVPIADGDYVLEDGTMFTTAAGVVTQVKEVTPAEPNPGATGTPAPTGTAMTENQVKSVIESVIRESHFAKQITELTENVNELTKVKESFASQKETSDKEAKEMKEKYELIEANFKKALDLIEQIAAEPSTDSAEGNKTKKEKINIHEFRKNYKADLEKITNQTN